MVSDIEAQEGDASEVIPSGVRETALPALNVSVENHRSLPPNQQPQQANVDSITTTMPPPSADQTTTTTAAAAEAAISTAIAGEDGQFPPQQQQQQQRRRTTVRDRLQYARLVLAGVAGPVLIVLFLVVPGVVVIGVLVGVCLIPTILLFCLACCFYCVTPETAGVYWMGHGPDHPSRRWFQDIIIESSDDENRTPTPPVLTREELVQELILLVVVDNDTTTTNNSENDNNHNKNNKNPTPVAANNISGGEEKFEEDDDDYDVAVDTTNDRIGGTVSLSDVSECGICLLDYEAGDVLAASKNPECNHLFHKECLLDWLEKNQICPSCRRSYLVNSNHSNNSRRRVSTNEGGSAAGRSDDEDSYVIDEVDYVQLEDEPRR